MIDAVVELSNIEIHEHCMLNRITGEREYNNEKKQMPYFTGKYFKEENIYLTKTEKSREFRIEEYNICIQYRTSQYVGFDVWSDEKDVDLFYQIEQSYKDNEYYKKFTK